MNTSIKLTLLGSSVQSSKMFIGAIHAAYLMSTGISLSKIALLQIIFSITVLILEFPTGIFSDTLGRKKSVIISTFLFCTYYPICLFSPNMTALIISEILYGFAVSLISGAIQGWIVESIKREYSQKEKYIEYFNYFTQETSAFGMMFAGLIGAIIGAGGDSDSFKMVYVLSSIVMLILCFCFFTIPDYKGLKTDWIPQSINRVKRSLRIIFTKRYGIVFAIITTLTAISYQPILNFWQPLLMNAAKNPLSLSLIHKHEILFLGATFFSANLFTYIMTRFVRKTVLKKYDSSIIGAIAAFFSGAILLVIGLNFLPALSLFIICSFLRGFLAVVESATDALFYKIVPTHDISSAISAASMVSRVFVIISLAVIGLTIDKDFYLLFLAAAMPLFIAAILFLTWKFNTQENEEKLYEY